MPVKFYSEEEYHALSKRNSILQHEYFASPYYREEARDSRQNGKKAGRDSGGNRGAFRKVSRLILFSLFFI